VWSPLEAEWEEEATTDLSRPTDFGAPPPFLVAAENAVLIRMEGAEAGRVYSLTESTCRVGRLLDNNIVIDDGDVSRHHARLTSNAGTWVIEDAGSRNGTYVQGRLIKQTVLNPGDLIQLGPRTSLRFDRIDRQQEQLLKQLYDCSTRDGLTGAFNRKHFNDRLVAEIAFAARHAAQVGLVLFDIDHFKRINDSLGHPAGDAVLEQLAGRVARQLRAEDVFARIGGEEFAVLLRGIGVQGAAQLGERLRRKVEATSFEVVARPVDVTISVGCAALTGREASAGVLVKLADARLYVAKRTGRNRVVASGP
jgi:diguanylate cyclase (GGDEF)-like protein